MLQAILHVLQNPLMIYVWAIYAMVLGGFWHKWGCACYAYLMGWQAPQFAFSAQGYVIVGLKTQRAGVVYGLQFGR